MSEYMKRYEAWLASPKTDDATRAELEAIRSDDKEILSRFGAYMEFGTAGLRSTMCAGTNRMNVYTVSHATQGFAALILREGGADRGAVIAYDSRNNSELFAKCSASVLAANGVKTYLFDALRPTPELSFAIRELGCIAGINITASHNPMEYNGYKAYWEDGSQLSPDQAKVVSDSIMSADLFDDVKTVDFDEAVRDGRITIIGAEMDARYLDAVAAQTVNPTAVSDVADEMKIVYTPLFGTGYRLVPEILRRIGVRHLYTVEAQMTPNGNFPGVKYPNPEFPEAFAEGIRIAEAEGSDLIIATDPDADRVGVMARGSDGAFHTITGNQMGALLLDYIITAYEAGNCMPEDPYAVKTIVTSELVSEICARHGVKLHNVLTGFKFIGEVIKNHEIAGKGSFLFGFEESYGYLKGTYARDKDAVVASMLIAEMACYYKANGMTLCDALDRLFERYGYYREGVMNIAMAGLDGSEKMKRLMASLRENPPKEIAGMSISEYRDYQAETITNLVTGEQTSTGLPKSNVLYYTLENGDVVVIRPSGTEPKVKIYLLVRADSAKGAEEKTATLKAAMENLLAE